LLEYLFPLVQRYRGVYPERTLLGPVKELVKMLGRAILDDGAFRKNALRTQSLDQLLGYTEQELGRRGAEHFDWDAEGGKLETSGSVGDALHAA
jgi:hypothetical protein